MSPIAGKDVLVVEDESLIVMMVEDLLRDLKTRSVQVASTVQEALDLLETRSFDAAILDIKLKRELSSPVAERLRERRIPYLVATGYAEYQRELGGRVLTKPYTPAQLADALASLGMEAGPSV